MKKPLVYFLLLLGILVVVLFSSSPERAIVKSISVGLLSDPVLLIGELGGNYDVDNNYYLIIYEIEISNHSPLEFEIVLTEFDFPVGYVYPYYMNSLNMRQGNIKGFSTVMVTTSFLVEAPKEINVIEQADKARLRFGFLSVDGRLHLNQWGIAKMASDLTLRQVGD